VYPLSSSLHSVLGNGSVRTSPRQRMHAKIEQLLDSWFSIMPLSLVGPQQVMTFPRQRRSVGGVVLYVVRVVWKDRLLVFPRTVDTLEITLHRTELAVIFFLLTYAVVCSALICMRLLCNCKQAFQYNSSRMTKPSIFSSTELLLNVLTCCETSPVSHMDTSLSYPVSCCAEGSTRRSSSPVTQYSVFKGRKFPI
jgi:hypothetical protein